MKQEDDWNPAAKLLQKPDLPVLKEVQCEI